MIRKVEIIDRQTVFQKAIFRIEETRLRHERHDGQMSAEITRLNLDRGDSVAAIIHNREDDTLVLVNQFRYPTYGPEDGWLWELPAGIIREGEDPTEAMRRELMEETGYDVLKLNFIRSFFLSPGGSSERVHLFYASVSPTNQTAAGGGVPSEDEDIETLHILVDDAIKHLESGNLHDAKTMIGVQWLVLHRHQLDELA